MSFVEDYEVFISRSDLRRDGSVMFHTSIHHWENFVQPGRMFVFVSFFFESRGGEQFWTACVSSHFFNAVNNPFFQLSQHDLVVGQRLIGKRFLFLLTITPIGEKVLDIRNTWKL